MTLGAKEETHPALAWLTEGLTRWALFLLLKAWGIKAGGQNGGAWEEAGARRAVLKRTCSTVRGNNQTVGGGEKMTKLRTRALKSISDTWSPKWHCNNIKHTHTHKKNPHFYTSLLIIAQWSCKIDFQGSYNWIMYIRTPHLIQTFNSFTVLMLREWIKWFTFFLD